MSFVCKLNRIGKDLDTHNSQTLCLSELPQFSWPHRFRWRRYQPDPSGVSQTKDISMTTMTDPSSCPLFSRSQPFLHCQPFHWHPFDLISHPIRKKMLFTSSYQTTKGIFIYLFDCHPIAASSGIMCNNCSCRALSVWWKIEGVLMRHSIPPRLMKTLHKHFARIM